MDEEGEVSWRSASVRKRSVGDFTAVVLYPDGMPDEDFVEKYSVSDEGVEWRYPSKPLGKQGKAASRVADPGLAIGLAGTASAGGEAAPSVSSLATPSPTSAPAGKPKKARFPRETVALLEKAFSELNGVTPVGEALAEVRHRSHPTCTQPAPNLHPPRDGPVTTPHARLQMRALMGLEATQLQGWFSSRRHKLKKVCATPEPVGRGSIGTYDPISTCRHAPGACAVSPTQEQAQGVAADAKVVDV